MKYVSGLPALGMPCERQSVGIWNVSKVEFLDNFETHLRDTDDSPFKDYGIEKNRIVRKREYCVYNVADHVRVYLDYLYECKFEELRGLFHFAIKDLKCRSDIFMMTFYRLKELPIWDSVNMFMTEEFGNAWESYISSIYGVSEHIAKQQTSMEQLKIAQLKAEKGEPLGV